MKSIELGHIKTVGDFLDALSQFSRDAPMRFGSMWIGTDTVGGMDEVPAFITDSLPSVLTEAGFVSDQEMFSRAHLPDGRLDTSSSTHHPEGTVCMITHAMPNDEGGLEDYYQEEEEKEEQRSARAIKKELLDSEKPEDARNL